jgi:hypothetical protein
MDRALNRMAIDIERLAKMTVPVKGGQLKSSGQHQRVGRLKYVVYFNKEYAAHVEFGVRAHQIAPKNKDFLAFKIGEKWVYTKKAVMHPGFKGRFFLSDAIKTIIAKDIEYIRKEAKGIDV